jgi:hypothetical protein
VYKRPLVPDNFDVPAVLETEQLRLRPLTINDAIKDFDAVVTSEQRLRSVYDPAETGRRG